jgi:hypothetical protein
LDMMLIDKIRGIKLKMNRKIEEEMYLEVRKEKQKYLVDSIVESGIDQIEFAQYMASLKGIPLNSKIQTMVQILTIGTCRNFVI